MATSEASSNATPRKREVALEGILVPRRWKASGEVTALALNTIDEREYVIHRPECEPRELLPHLRKRVRLTGLAIGNRLVRIASVTVLDALDTSASPSAGGAEQ